MAKREPKPAKDWKAHFRPAPPGEVDEPVPVGDVTLRLTLPARHVAHLDALTKLAVRESELEAGPVRQCALALRLAVRVALESGGADAS